MCHQLHYADDTNIVQTVKQLSDANLWLVSSDTIYKQGDETNMQFDVGKFQAFCYQLMGAHNLQQQ